LAGGNKIKYHIAVPSVCWILQDSYCNSAYRYAMCELVMCRGVQMCLDKPTDRTSRGAFNATLSI